MQRQKKLVITTAVLAVLFTATAAVALWNATATGSGQATATTAVSATISTASGDADLYPGVSTGDVSFTITNDNPYPVVFTDMTPGAVSSSDEANCPASNVTIDPATGLDLDVGAGATTATLGIEDVVSMAEAAPDECQGATFTIALELSGLQSTP